MTERTIFLTAIEIADLSKRMAYLDQACGGNAKLRSDVDALLNSHQQSSQFLETPATAGNSAVELTLVSHGQGDGDDDQNSAASTGEAELRKYLQPSTRPGWLGRLAHYEIEEILGRGAFGIVAKAYDEKLHRVVAIKLMNPDLASTSAPRKRFLREARTAAAVRHDNIVGIHAVEEEPLPYLVMDYIHGITLQQRLDQNGPLEVPEILRIGQQVAAGLAAAHAANLIHRDIKPSNILLEGGIENRAKISDFGLARAVDDASLTQSGLIAGTPMYMAPEQARGEILDHRADLFSLGSVLYHITSGRAPFRAPNTIAVLKRVCDDTPRPIEDVIPGTPDWLCTIINRLLEKRPSDRYQTAKEVADLFARCQAELQLNGKVTCVENRRPIRRDEPSAPTATPSNAAKTHPASIAPARSAVPGVAAAETVDGSPSPGRSAGSEWRIVGLSALILLVAAVVASYPLNLGMWSKPKPSESNTNAIASSGPSSSENSDLDRRAAEWVQSIGGKMTISVAGQHQETDSTQNLPVQPFQVVNVSLYEIPRVNDAGLKHLSELTNLKILRLNNNAQLSDAGLKHLKGLTNLTSLQLQNNYQLSDAGVEHLKDLTNLTTLMLHGTKVGDVGLEHLKHLTDLTVLDLRETQVTDAGLENLKGFSLVSLYLRDTKVSDAGLEHIKDHTKLSLLWLNGTQVTDVGLQHLRGLTGLTELSLSTTRVGDAGLEHLKGLTNLESLDLFNTQLSDAGLEHLAGFKGLVVLNLAGTRVTDNGLDKLKVLTKLSALYLDNTNTTPVGVAALRTALPNCKITWSAATKPLPEVDLDETDPLQAWQLPQGAPPPVVAPCEPKQATELQQQWAEFLKRPVVEEFSSNAPLGMKFALIPPGEFRKVFTRLHDPAVEPDMPVRRFRLTKPYAIATTEVTWDQFRQFVEATDYQTEAEANGLGGHNRELQPDPKVTWRNPGWKPAPHEPVTQVSSRDAEAFCDWLTTQAAIANRTSVTEDQKSLYRLPTEAEWVHACRAGSVNKHVVGPNPQDLADAAWTREFLEPNPQASPLHRVARKKPNSFGLYDTLGNVWECTQDFMPPALLPYLPTNDPLGLPSPSLIGQSWYEGQNETRADWMYSHTGVYPSVGFRVLNQFDSEPLPDRLNSPLALHPGQPMSVHALVPRPERIPGLRSWSLELAGSHAQNAQIIAMNPKGDLIATGDGNSSYGKISLWDRNGNYQRALLGYEGDISSLDFSPDGRWLASCDHIDGIRGSGGCTARIWNAETGALHALIPLPQQGRCVSFSPNGEQLLIGYADDTMGGSFAVFDLLTGVTLQSAVTPVYWGLAWSPNGDRISYSIGTNHVRICDAKSFKVLQECECPLARSIAWSPDGEWLALQTPDHKVAIRNAKSLELHQTIDAEITNYAAHSLRWLPDSRRLVVASPVGKSGIYDATTGERLTELRFSSNECALSANATEVVVMLENIKVFSTDTGELLREGPPPIQNTTSHSSLTADGGDVISVGHNGRIRSLDAITGELKSEKVQAIGGGRLSPDGKLVAQGDGRPGLMLLITDAQTGAKLHDVSEGEASVTNAMWSPDSKWLATRATDKLIRIWNVATGMLEHELAGQTGNLSSLAWSPDGARLASTADDNTVRLWESQTGKLVATYDQLPEPIRPEQEGDAKLAWSSDGHQLWIALIGHIVPLDVETGVFGPMEDFSNGNNVAFVNMSPNGQRLLVRQYTGWTFVRGSDAQDRRLLGQYLGQTAQWHPDSRRFLGWERFYGTVGFDVETNRRLGIIFPWLTGDHWLCIGPTGHYRGSVGVEDQFVYVAQLEDGTQITLSAAEFSQKFGWKNDPEKATLLKLEEDK